MARRQPADPFGFNKAIQTDHLTDEQVAQVNEIFESCPQHPYERRRSCTRQGCPS